MDDIRIHRFEIEGRRFAIDVETCFCFECDAVSWDVLAHYPHTPVNRIYALLADRYPETELREVVGELEWLRATKSILPPRKLEDQHKIFDLDKGLAKVSVSLPREPATVVPAKRRLLGRSASVSARPSALELVRDAVTMLLGRAEGQKDLEVEFVEDNYVRDPATVIAGAALAVKAIRAAGKTPTVSLRVADIAVNSLPASLDGHTFGIRLELKPGDLSAGVLGSFTGTGPASLARLLKNFEAGEECFSGKIVLRPNHPGFGDAVKVLDEIGFHGIEIDIDEAYIANPSLRPQDMLPAMAQCAKDYASRLLKNHYFRVDPIAGVFWRIYNGTVTPRADPTGTQSLAVDGEGRVFPSRRFREFDGFQVGSLVDGVFDSAALRRFEDVGAATTPACMKCWARNLCGGGSAAVHHAIGGDFRVPDPNWCDAQRDWFGVAVSAFNELSTAGVNFTRIYHALDRPAKQPISWFTLARAAFLMNIGMRPLAETDAEMLASWESWNRSAFFLCNERAIFIANQYDRELDALHPRPLEFESLLIHKNGKPFGLFKVRPDILPGVADGYIYFHEPEAYASDGVRRSFRMLLKEASAQQSLRSLMVPAAPWETELHAFLEAAGFTREGVQREALYTKGVYNDLFTYRLRADTL